MIAAYEAARGALVVKHQSIAAVRADIVERLDRPVLGPRDQHRCLRQLDRLADVTTRLREPLDPSDAEPGALEETLHIGRATCRERVCQYVENSVDAL